MPKPKKIMTKFGMGEVSFVRKPAQKGALATVLKSDDDLAWMDVEELLVEEGVGPSIDDINKSLADSMTTSDKTGHQHGIRLRNYGEGRAELHLSYAGSKADEQHSHEVVMNSDGSFTVTENFGHSHEINADEIRMLLMSALAKSDFEIPEKAEIADLLALWDQSGDETLEKDADMADQNTKAADEAKAAEALAKAEKERDDALEEARVAKAEAEMNDTEKAFMAKLDKEAAGKFRDMKRKERMEEMKKADDVDPVVYKSDRTGAEFRKSDDPRMVEIAKAADEDHAELKKARVAAEESGFTKTAETDFAHLPGKVEVRAALAKAIAKSGESDEMQKQMLESLKGQSVNMSKSTKTLGRGGIAKSDGDDATLTKRDDAADELDRLAEEIQKGATETMSFEDAYEKACKDNPEVYKAAIAGDY